VCHRAGVDKTEKRKISETAWNWVLVAQPASYHYTDSGFLAKGNLKQEK
jgi:hypothetical protein